MGYHEIVERVEQLEARAGGPTLDTSEDLEVLAQQVTDLEKQLSAALARIANLEAKLSGKAQGTGRS